MARAALPKPSVNTRVKEKDNHREQTKKVELIDIPDDQAEDTGDDDGEQSDAKTVSSSEEEAVPKTRRPVFARRSVRGSGPASSSEFWILTKIKAPVQHHLLDEPFSSVGSLKMPAQKKTKPSPPCESGDSTTDASLDLRKLAETPVAPADDSTCDEDQKTRKFSGSGLGSLPETLPSRSPPSSTRSSAESGNDTPLMKLLEEARS